MRAMPYLIKNSAGVWCVQRKVPQKLEVAVARVLGGKKDKQAYLKKSLGTKYSAQLAYFLSKKKF